jgi:hypothetical protein
MKPEDYTERKLELAGWPVKVTSYKLGEKYLAIADNVSPGANIARAEGPTKAEAEQGVIEKAEKRLAATRQVAIE